MTNKLSSISDSLFQVRDSPHYLISITALWNIKVLAQERITNLIESVFDVLTVLEHYDVNSSASLIKAA